MFLSSFTTGYYVFGEMYSGMTLMFILVGIALQAFALIAQKKWGGSFWVSFLTFAIIAILTAGALLLVGDRVEGIGNCIVTDYDSGHGGEEAIYRSLAAAGFLLAGAVCNIIGSFAKAPEEKAHIQVI